MIKKEVEEMVFNAGYLKDLLLRTFSDATDAYDVLFNYDDDIKYVLSLNLLSMSYQTFLEMQRVYHQNGLEHYEIDPFFSDYQNFKFQLKQVITQRDTNTSWLTAQYNTLVESKKSIIEFIDNFIKSSR